MKNTIIVYGRHAVNEVISNKNRKIHKIYSTRKNLDLVANRPELEVVSDEILEANIKKYNNNKLLHQGIFAIVNRLSQPKLEIILSQNPNFLLLLDEIQDSQNLGAIIRSALLFKSNAVITTLNNSPDENSQIIKAASGAFERIPLVKVVNLTDTINILKKQNFWIIGLSCNGNKNLREVALKFKQGEKIGLVIGNEERGIRQRVADACDFLVKIPINNQSNLDSLNASNAAAIALYEISQSLNY
jgi:23S rRNA (guanosine2251-2'-O)-methyltransferase